MSTQSIAQALLAVLLAVPAARLGAENRLFVNDQQVGTGQQGVEVPVRLDNDQPLFGFSLSIKTDVAVLEIQGVDLQGTSSEDAEWTFGEVLDGGAWVSWGVVLDVSDPFDVEKVVPVGQDLTIAKLIVDVVATEEATATVRFENVPSSNPLETPDRKNTLVNQEGKPAAHVTSPGTITVTADQPPTFKRGNSNGDGSIDISDAVYHLNFLFLGGPAPPCLDASDTDDNGKLEITDAIYLLTFLFQGGPPPKPPFPDPGPDPTDEDPPLGCAG